MKDYTEAYTWTTAKGDKIHVDDMTETHAKNVLKLILRKIYEFENKPKETNRQKLIREMNDPNHNPFQGEIAAEQWDYYMLGQADYDEIYDPLPIRHYL